MGLDIACKCYWGAYCSHAILLLVKINTYSCPFGSCFKHPEPTAKTEAHKESKIIKTFPLPTSHQIELKVKKDAKNGE